MAILEIFRAEYLSIIFGGIAGLLSAWITQRVLNKRGVFSYFVNHSKVGMSADDSVFGKVTVEWNNNPVQHLYLSTLELKNESLNDYENVIINTYTSDTWLLSESSQIIGTPDILEWSSRYKKDLFVDVDQKPTAHQSDLYGRQRQHIIPVFNRGQEIKISYLNAAKGEPTPTIWLSATIKGVKVKFQPPQQLMLGIPQRQAAFVGVVIGLACLIPLVSYIQNPWVIAISAITYGFIAQIPGAYSIKAYRKTRDVIGS